MNVTLARQSYGKSDVRLTHVTRHDDYDDLVQLTAQIRLAGGFESAYTAGDNTRIIPTDTMRNVVYALAKTHGLTNIESFARQLARHFVERYAHVRTASVEIRQQPWQRICVDGNDHGHAFVGARREQYTCAVTATQDGLSQTSGIAGMQLLKTASSGFKGFLHDEFTTLQETDDRILATSITATWPCKDLDRDWATTRLRARDAMLGVFARNYSPSIQRTLHEMAEIVIATCPEIDELSIEMSNEHHLLVDLSAMNLDNANEIFVPTSEPFGVISATIERRPDDRAAD